MPRVSWGWRQWVAAIAAMAVILGPTGALVGWRLHAARSARPLAVPARVVDCFLALGIAGDPGISVDYIAAGAADAWYSPIGLTVSVWRSTSAAESAERQYRLWMQATGGSVDRGRNVVAAWDAEPDERTREAVGSCLI